MKTSIKTSGQYSVLIINIMHMYLFCLFILLFLCPPPAFSAAPTAAYLQNISGNLYAPGRIAVDINGNIYVADPRQDKVQVYAADGSLKYTVANFQGTPLGVAVDGSNNLYISDAKTKSVMVFDSSWNYIRKLGSGDNEFGLPGDIAISDSAGKIYVTDSQNNAVKVYSTSDGALTSTFGGYDPSAAGMFNFPTGIAVDNAASKVIVVDEGTSSAGRLQFFQLDGTYNAGFSITAFPQGITVDDAGRIYVADTYEGYVYVYDTSGTQLSTIGSFGTSGGQLMNPMDVVIDNYNRLFITSSGNAQVVIYGIDSYSIPPPCDATPPVTEHSVSATVGQNGWYKSNIRIGLSAADSGETCPGGVSKIEYSFNGTTWSEFTSLIDVTTDGSIPFYYRATDVYGNVESYKTATLKIDKTPPTLSAFISPPPNANNWNNTDVTVSFTASDNASGVASLPSTVTLTNEGSWQVTGEAKDYAGNTTTLSYEVKIDKSAPTVAIISPSNNLVTSSDVTLEYTAAGYKTIEGDASGTVYTQEGIYTKTITAANEAGNTAQAAVTFTIDKSAPAINITSPANNLITNSNVTLEYTAAGYKTIEGDASGTVYTQEGIYTKTITATDEAGNTATAAVTFTIDKSAPTVAITSPSNNLVTSSDVTLEYTAAGYKTIEGDASGTVYTQEGIYTKTITATDEAGNTAQAAVTFTIDKTPPEIIITSPVDNMVAGESITLEYTITDATNVTIEGDASGTVYTQEGTYTKTITATDEAGNSTTVAVVFTFIVDEGVTVETSAPAYADTAKKTSEEKPKEAEAEKEEKPAEKTGAAVITIISPKDGLITNGDVKLEYTVEGAEKIEGDASGTVYTKAGVYTKAIAAIDKDGGRTTKKITFTIDKTAPEAEISYDIYNMDIKVSGTDNITKDVIITKAETGFSYTLTDEAGNTLIILFEKMDRDADKLAASIGSLIYNGAAIMPNDNSMDVTIDIDSKTNSIKKIIQTYRLKNMLKLIADYDKKKNTTKITTGDDKDIKAKDKKKDKTASSSGMKVIKVLTKAGELSYGY